MYFTGDWLEDNYIMSDILDQIEFYSGTERKKLLKKNGVKHPKNAGSMLWGTTWRGYLSPTKMRTKAPFQGLYYTKVHDLYPDLDDIFNEFSSYYFKDFEFDQVQMNKNYPIPRHKDSKNIGDSVLCCFGDYTGGETCVEYENETKIYKPNENPVIFNGSQYYHYINKFEGDRYSLVFFRNNRKKSI